MISCGPPKTINLKQLSDPCSADRLSAEPVSAALTESNLLWEKSYDYSLYMGLTGSSGVLFIPVPDNKLYLIDANNGKRIAEIKFREPIMAPVATSDSLAVLNIGGNKLSVLNWVTGKMCWETDLNGAFGGAAVWDNKVYWVDGTNFLHCNEIREGRRIWDLRLSGSVNRNIVVSALGAIFFTNDGIIECLDPQSGIRRWSFDVDAKLRNAPSPHEDRLFFCTTDGTVICLEMESGNMIWMTELESEVFGEVAVDERGVYIGTEDWDLIRLDYDSGDILWSVRADGPVIAAPSLAGETAVFVSLDFNAYFIEKDTGKTLSKFSSRGMLTSRPLVCGDLAFVAGEDSYLYCFDLREGE